MHDVIFKIFIQWNHLIINQQFLLKIIESKQNKKQNNTISGVTDDLLNFILTCAYHM